MDEPAKRREPKKIRLLPLVDRYAEYDTLYGETTDLVNKTNEDNSENNSQSISELESM